MKTGTEIIKNIKQNKVRVQQLLTLSLVMSVLYMINIITSWSYWGGLMGINLLIIGAIWIILSTLCFYYTDKLFKELPI